MSERQPRISEAAECYLHIREVFGGETTSLRARLRRAKAEEARDPDDESAEPFGTGRDPVAAGDALDHLMRAFAWTEPLEQASLIQQWPTIAGPGIASHATALHVDDGALVIQCDSTAWATQLRALRGEFVTRIQESFPKAGVTSIRVLAPGAPSWKRGPRSVPGRGPRDTYG